MDRRLNTEDLVKGNLSNCEFVEKRIYRCALFNRCGCPFKLCVDYHRKETTIEVMWNGENHDHNSRHDGESALQAVEGGHAPKIPPTTKEKIKEFLDDGFTTSQIH